MQNDEPNNKKETKEKKKEMDTNNVVSSSEKKQVYPSGEVQLSCKPKDNENLILMTQNYHRLFENNCECSTLNVQSKLLTNSHWMSSEKLNELRRRAHDAVRTQRVFVLKGYFHTVRKALTDRGWVEKIVDGSHRVRGITSSGFLLEDLVQALPPRRPGESKKAHIVKCERSIMSRFLEHSPVHLLWTVRRDKSDWTHLTKNQNMLINRFSKAPFTSKEGLCLSLKEFYWYFEEGKSEMYFPRCYNVFNPDELNEFIENFRTTACVSFLKWLVETFDEKGPYTMISDEGKVPFSAINFAMNRCKDFIDYCLHNDIDVEEEIKIWEHDWDVFLTHHYLVTHENAKLQSHEESINFEEIVNDTKRLLEKIKPLWPQYGLDGTLNIWIIKPGNKCRGRGIMLMNNIKQIISIVNPPISKSRYVVQKYIERPLIIHKTKFDIRQWFLITSAQPLTIWFYKESYLRFSSQQYNLSNYHESVHLTNYAIQKKYTNGVRDDRLPIENMWDCHTFQAYLRQIGKYEMWSNRIYPGMQKAIIGTMLACQENMDRRPNTFELYGADFMISEDFYPWLIEINASPDLAPSTSVTARLCPQAVEDTIKVVIDRRNDANAETGYFELIYKQVIPKTPAYMGLNLSLRGQRITPKCLTKQREKSPSVKSIQSIYTLARLASSSNRPRKTNSGATILDFMQCLNFKTRLDREKELIRKKIRTSTLYRKPSFTYNIYNPLSSTNSSNKISKNIKSDFKEELLKKSVKLLGEEHDGNEGNNDEKSLNPTIDIQCIGNKYVDLTCNIMPNTLPTTPKFLEAPLSESNNSKSSSSVDWEKATTSILQANNLSPSSSTSSYQLLKKQLAQEHLKKPNTAKPTAKSIDLNSVNNCDNTNSDKLIVNSESALNLNNINFNDICENGELMAGQKNSPQIETEKRKKNSKLFKKSSNSHFLTVGLSLRSKYNDANISLIETENILTNHKIDTATTTTTKTKKSSPRKKKSSHSKANNNSNTTKSSTKSAFINKKAEM